MSTMTRNGWQNWFRRNSRESTLAPAPAPAPEQTITRPVEIAPNDPIVAYFSTAPGVVDLESLNLESPALHALKAAGTKLVVPLVSQGELVGLLNLGPRLSEQDYTTDDRALLNNLATQAAPALRVAQLVRQQQAELVERERIEQELRVARLIQQTLLPKDVPDLAGYHVAAYYRPARAVGGDFYDFLYFPDGKLGLVIGDVTDKGVPAALVMATTRSILRSAAQQELSPGRVLEQTNNSLLNDIPPKMFVTCLYAILDPLTGCLRYANAGHDLPYLRHETGVSELRARGMPLGLLPGMQYEEKEAQLLPGDSLLFYSDGLVEAHDPHRDMFGFPRLAALMARPIGGTALVDMLLTQLAGFTGEGWEQEDDVTLVTLERSASAPASSTQTAEPQEAEMVQGEWQTLGEFQVPSVQGNERLVVQHVAQALAGVDMGRGRLDRLKTAVAEASMNAIEHGNHYHADVPVWVRVLRRPTAIAVRITDQGGGQAIPQAQMPDLDAKLAGLQTPRGWGLFLIKNMVDEMHISTDAVHHTVELIVNLEGADDGSHHS